MTDKKEILLKEKIKKLRKKYKNESDSVKKKVIAVQGRALKKALKLHSDYQETKEIFTE
jgi:hypothetical protein